MFQIIFCIGLMFSAWATWRANPLYTVRSTFRTLVVMLLVISAGILLIVGAVRLSMGHSNTFIYVTLAITIMVDVWMMTLLLTLFTTPANARPAALPHGTVLVNTNRATAKKVAVVLLIGIAVVFVVGLVLPEAARIILFTLGGFTAFLAVMLVPILYWAERRVDISQTAVTLSPWVHWSYTPAQWSAWADVQRDRLSLVAPTITLRRTGPKLLVAVVAIAAGVYAFCPGGWVWKTCYVLGVSGMLAGLMVLSGRGERHAADTLHRRLMRAAPEVYFGMDGMLADGIFSAWINADSWLVSAARDDRDPRSLLFHFERQVPNPYGAPNRIEIYHSILLPEHSEADVARLSEDLKAKCPNAEVELG